MVKSSSSSQDKNTKIATLSKSFSRKLLKKGFWKKIDRKEIISCVEEKSEPLNGSTSDDVNGSRRVGETVGDYRHSMDVTNSSNSGSTTSTGSKKCWTNEEKEQFSPVSVLDCPFDEEDEVCSSPFRHNRLYQDEETKKKLRKFERLAQLEPVNLENRLVCDQESIQCDQLNSSKTSLINFMLETEEEKPMKLLQLIKDTTSFELKVDDLLLDFFNERLLNVDEQSKANELLSAAKDWINGKYHEFSVDWEVRKNRQAFLRDIEKKGEWKKMYEDIKEMAMELEDEIFSDLVNELMDDLV